MLPYHDSLPLVQNMETTVTTKGQLTLPVQVRRALGIDTGTVLEVELGAEGCVVLRKRATPGFFDQFVGLKAAGAPFASGDEAREEMRVEEGAPPSSAATLKPKKSRRR
jgi:AbrB family looped-hinge helix DNA binding protein